jgi:hypothetical protein
MFFLLGNIHCNPVRFKRIEDFYHVMKDMIEKHMGSPIFSVPYFDKGWVAAAFRLRLGEAIVNCVIRAFFRRGSPFSETVVTVSGF